jgi:ABC-2 type transport system permease protein
MVSGTAPISRPNRSVHGFGLETYLRIVGEIAWTIGRTRIQGMGPIPYTLTWVSFPVFQLLLLALIYRENQALLDYAVIAGSGTSLLFAMIFNGGEILDTERQRGTLGNLFLSPCPRYIWLAGFQIFAFVESLVTAAVSVGIAVVMFDVSISINVPSVIVTLLLFLSCLWGISMMLGAIGVLARGANLISNLVYPLVGLLSGIMYPIALMPDWIRIPARILPFGYGIQALVDAMTTNASLADIRDDLLALAGFAIVLPVLGVLAFSAVERAVRRQGYLELS